MPKKHTYTAALPDGTVAEFATTRSIVCLLAGRRLPDWHAKNTADKVAGCRMLLADAEQRGAPAQQVAMAERALADALAEQAAPAPWRALMWHAATERAAEEAAMHLRCGWETTIIPVS